VDVSLEASEVQRRADQPHVSILVLVDVSLEEQRLSPPRIQVPVSILVLVDVSLEVRLLKFWIWFSGEFQSLFSWMFRSKGEPCGIHGEIS